MEFVTRHEPVIASWWYMLTVCCEASVSLSDLTYATLLIVINDPSATPFPVTVQTLLPISVDRSTHSLQVSVTIPSNNSQIHLMFPLNCQLRFTTSMSVPLPMCTIQIQTHTVTKIQIFLMMGAETQVVSWLWDCLITQRSVVADAETKAWSCAFILVT